MAPIMAARVGVRRNAVSAAFSPTSLSGLAVWFDAGQITGATDGAAVATWQDRSGNAKDAVQATASKQPIYRSTGTSAQITPSGKPSVQFDGVDDFVATANAVAVSVHTGFIVFSTSGATGGFMSNLTSQAADASFGLIYAAAPSYETLGGVGNGCYGSNIWKDGTSSTAVTNDGTWHVTVGVATGFAGTAQFPTALALGGDRMGSLNRYTPYCCAEVITYNRLLTTTERQQVEAYLKAKHGTP